MLAQRDASNSISKTSYDAATRYFLQIEDDVPVAMRELSSLAAFAQVFPCDQGVERFKIRPKRNHPRMDFWGGAYQFKISS
jgi:hypothetical protein